MMDASAGSASDASSTKRSSDVASRTRFYPPRTYSDSSEQDQDAATLLPARSRGRLSRPSSYGARSSNVLLRRVRRATRRCVGLPYVPARPLTIIASLSAFTAFAVSLTFFLIWYLNPDKVALPWRAYCAVPRPFSSPHIPHLPKSGDPPLVYAPPFPPPNLDNLPPAGVWLGVFTIAKGIQRRMLIRSTWAAHHRSRNGAGDGDAGNGTSRTVVRFVMGKPAKEYEAMVAMEMETYHDIVILPMRENMNSGKTHAFFTWAAENAWVPPPSVLSAIPTPQYSYSTSSTPAPALALHDPAIVRADAKKRPWVRPDFIFKCDDDSFVMLAELESRLRVELHSTPANGTAYWSEDHPIGALSVHGHERTRAPVAEGDPLIFWGYLVKNRFMGGEIYGMSYALATWVAGDARVAAHVSGAEDKVTSRWMEMHPRTRDIRWVSERCWVYNHPRSGTVYSHGFLFPSEASRVRVGLEAVLGKTARAVLDSPWTREVLANARTPAAWAASSVQTFGTPYTPPVLGLPPAQAVEALVEGATMSLLQEGGETTPEYAWERREGRNRRYEGKRVGGTVAVHFVKHDAWFLETALALLEGDDVTEMEREPGQAM